MPVSAINKRLLVAKQNQDDAGAVDVGRLGMTETVHYFNWAAGVGSGAVSIETADEADYTGTWALLQTVTFSGTSPKQDVVKIQGSYKALRHRVSTALAGGTVTSRIVGS